MLDRHRTIMLLNVLVIAAVAVFILRIDHAGREARALPQRTSTGFPEIISVDRQEDILAIYKERKIWGSRVVQVNRFLNMVEYYPKEETITMPFPIRTSDIRPAYERGKDSHNWLFIANRMGMVRSAEIVLPIAVFESRRESFLHDGTMQLTGTQVTGWAQDMPFTITRIDRLEGSGSAVILNIDAGFFEEGSDPVMVAQVLKGTFPEARMLVLCYSRDEPEVTAAMRDRLEQFESAYRAGNPGAAVR